jgi:hypothetical protein
VRCANSDGVGNGEFSDCWQLVARLELAGADLLA